MRFWDSSAVAALCVEEPRTAEVERLAREDPELVVWWRRPSSAPQPSPGAESVTFDERMAEAGCLEGLAVLPASRRTASAPDTASD